ncbi:rho guanine nucleotide exchange factor 3-like isoform X2 [Oratosquilla oratoria]|uniref:rho guanine nucleotide exchange factor 3-like isoform X2 n=1 Tax=Oratosquilla oratoria TaxID=337810 RepID=UPI003F763F1F
MNLDDSITSEDGDSVQGLFLEPTRRFTLRKRKRFDSDATSVHSLDACTLGLEAKRKKGLARMASFASLLTTPIKPAVKVGQALQRSLSGVRISSPVSVSRIGGLPTSVSSPGSVSLPASPSKLSLRRSSSVSSSVCSSRRSSTNLTPYRPPPPTPTRRRPSRTWAESLAHDTSQMSQHEIKRQEAIFEVYSGEEDMVEDLELVQRTYHDSLLHLHILQPEEVSRIFGDLPSLLPIHKDLAAALVMCRDQHGRTHSCGNTLLQWVPRLKAYISYCANQVAAKAFLDDKKASDKRFEDFLQRCLESPFSRKLDLWNFLDVPRSRLVKYPLLFKQILKYTDLDHEDCEPLAEAITILGDIISEVDRSTGEAQCQLAISRLEYLDTDQHIDEIDHATSLYCSGILRNNRGTKLHVFLFNTCMVLTRRAHRDQGMMYQVYRHPIPASSLHVFSTSHFENKIGSLRSSLAGGVSGSIGGKHLFRVGWREGAHGHSHTLIASDEHNWKQWIHFLSKVIEEHGGEKIITSNGKENKAGRGKSLRRSSDSNASLSSYASPVTWNVKRFSEPDISHTQITNVGSSRRSKSALSTPNQSELALTKLSNSSLTGRSQLLIPPPRKSTPKLSHSSRFLRVEDDVPRELGRMRTRSWSYLHRLSECDEEDEPPSRRRRSTRRQMSRSSSDLLQD